MPKLITSDSARQVQGEELTAMRAVNPTILAARLRATATKLEKQAGNVEFYTTLVDDPPDVLIAAAHEISKAAQRLRTLADNLRPND